MKKSILGILKYFLDKNKELAAKLGKEGNMVRLSCSIKRNVLKIH
jgi:hypothetical protein